MKNDTRNTHVMGGFTPFSQMDRSGCPKSEKLMSPLDGTWRPPPRTHEQLAHDLYPDRRDEASQAEAVFVGSLFRKSK